MSADTLLTISLVAIAPLALVGSLLHFAYDWSGRRRFVAVFAAVNESSWEHVKIALWPVLLWFVGVFAAGGWELPGLVPGATIGLYSLPVTLLAVVAGYKARLRRNVLWIDIAAFCLAVAVAVLLGALVATELDASGWTIGIATAFLLLLVGALVRFTLRPPAEPDIFVDPLNGRYGLAAHPEA